MKRNILKLLYILSKNLLKLSNFEIYTSKLSAHCSAEFCKWIFFMLWFTLAIDLKIQATSGFNPDSAGYFMFNENIDLFTQLLVLRTEEQEIWYWKTQIDSIAKWLWSETNLLLRRMYLLLMYPISNHYIW